MSDSESFCSALDTDSSSLSFVDSTSDQFIPLSTQIGQHLLKFPKLLNVCHLNAQSLPQHYSDFYDVFSINNYHAILISESWLKPSFSSSYVSLPGYLLLRNDRTGKGGGGVAVYLRSDIQYKILCNSPSQYSGGIEFLLLEIIVCGTKFALGVVYCPPNADFLSALESDLLSLCSEYIHQLIMGDFNIDLRKDCCRVRDFRTVLDCFNLSILPLYPTHHNIDTEDSWIDHIIVSRKDLVADHGQFQAPMFSRHDLIYISYKIKVPTLKPQVVYLRNFAGIGVETLQKDFAEINWDRVYSAPCVDSKVQELNSYILKVFNKHAPLHPVRIKYPPSPWISAEVRAAMNKRDRAFCYFKKHRSDENWHLYKLARNRCNQMVRNAKRCYIHNIINNSSPADVWKLLSKLNVVQPTDEGSRSISPNVLNDHFTFNQTLDADGKKHAISYLKSLSKFNSCVFNFSSVTSDAVRKIFNNLTSKAVGFDGIGRDMLVWVFDYLLQPLTHIINFSLASGSFPTIWRKAFVLPLPKVSNPVTPNQFRPISILSFLSKILEAVAHRQISAYAFKNNILSPFQSGFRPGHSTTTALLKVVDDIRTAIEESNLLILVLVDFSNAFNTVDYDILLAALDHLGCSSSALDWFSSYLRGRYQAVRIKGELSNWRLQEAGVPQGGILSPLLFSFFINFIVPFLSCSYHLYADDLQLYTQTDFDNINSAIGRLNLNLKNVSDWSTKFGVTVNPLKCQAIIFGSSRRLAKVDWQNISPITFNNLIIPFQPFVKNLGLILDTTLSWSPHVTEICRKVNSILHTFYRHKHFLPRNTKLLLVQALVLPIIDYVDVCYSDLTQLLLNRLEILLNNCIRFIFRLRKFDHISFYRSKIKWLPLAKRRKVRMLCMLYSIINDPNIPSYLKSKFRFQGSTHDRSLRSDNNLSLHLPLSRTRFTYNSFFIQSVKLWNTLPLNIRRSSSKWSFKRALMTHYLDRNF